MRILRPPDYRVMAWRNGGGTTTEIAIHPESSAISGVPFQWRVSIADVTLDGPFSLFPGYDRHIMVISGQGMRLDAGSRGMIDLGRPYVPASFSGDWDIRGTLTGGPVRDFNLMASRAETRSSLSCAVWSAPQTIAVADGHVVLHLLEGAARVADQTMAAGDTVCLTRGDSLDFIPAGEVRVAHCRIAPHPALEMR